MNFRASGKTDKGSVRLVNEDSFLIDEENKLFIVADGMGGHEAGDVASRMLVNRVQQFLSGKLQENTTNADTASLLIKAIQKANLEIYTYSQEQAKGSVMGTTAVLMTLVGDQYFISWAGDSRAYLYREGSLSRLTRDHSYVQGLVDAGEISEEEARVHPRRNVVTSAAGVDAEIEPECVWGQSMCGDVFLLCTDGLTGPLDDDTIGSILGEGSEPPMLSDALVNRSLHLGGDDNITVVVVGLF